MKTKNVVRPWEDYDYREFGLPPWEKDGVDAEFEEVKDDKK